MTLLQRLPGLQKAPGVRHGLSYLMDGARNLFAVVGDFNVHHKIPLDFFSGIAYTDSEETHVSVFRAEPLPVTGGGGGSFFISPRKEDRPVMQRNYICIKRFASCCSRIQYINSFLLINPILSNKWGALQITRCPFYPRRAGKNHREKIFAPCLPKHLRPVRILYHTRKNCQIVPFAHVT